MNDRTAGAPPPSNTRVEEVLNGVVDLVALLGEQYDPGRIRTRMLEVLIGATGSAEGRFDVVRRSAGSSTVTIPRRAAVHRGDTRQQRPDDTIDRSDLAATPEPGPGTAAPRMTIDNLTNTLTLTLPDEAADATFTLTGRPGGYDTALLETVTPLLRAATYLNVHASAIEQRNERELRIQTGKRITEALFEHSKETVLVLDVDGTPRHSAGRHVRTATDHDPRRADLLVHTDDRARAVKAFSDACATGKDQHLIVGLDTGGGERRLLELTIEDKRDEPYLAGMLVTARDVTRVIDAEEQTRHRVGELRTLIDNLRDAVILLDRDRRIVHLNRSHPELWGAFDDPLDLVGRNASDGSDANADKLAQWAEQTFTDPETVLRECAEAYANAVPCTGSRLTTRTGSVFEHDYLPIFDGDELTGHLWVWRNVTEHDLLEKERSRELERAAQQNRSLQELDRLKTEFIAMVSHELSTPVTSVVNFTGLLCETIAVADEPAATYLEILDRNARRLVRLVNDLLTIAKLDNGGIPNQTEPTDVAALVAMTVAAARPDLEASGTRVTTKLDPIVADVDPQRIEQVVKNLVDNAGKFAAGGHIGITLARGPTDWTLTVIDDGIGMSGEHTDRLVEPFVRGTNSLTRNIPGSGLGLAVVRSIVGKHSGTFTLLPRRQGVEATVTIPLHPDDRPETSS